jgi:hypothetical protein
LPRHALQGSASLDDLFHPQLAFLVNGSKEQGPQKDAKGKMSAQKLVPPVPIATNKFVSPCLGRSEKRKNIDLI